MSLSTSPLDVSPVIPVVVIDDPATAVPLARALLAGGVAIIEVTLRTPRALDAVAAIAAEVPEIALGVGSVLTADHVDQALAAGADFLVSPGASPALLERLVAASSLVVGGRGGTGLVPTLAQTRAHLATASSIEERDSREVTGA